MVYILTGVAKSGKSLVSKEIIKKKQLPLVSSDHIMMMLAKNNMGINPNASDSSVSKDLEPFLFAMIETMIENNEDYVIEGVHFNTSFIKLLKEKFSDQISVVYLGYKDSKVEDKVSELKRFKDKLQNDWIFHHKDSIQEIVDYLIKESNRLYKECKENRITYIEVKNIQEQVSEIIEILFDER
jgi:2-phosphoglycerate kinase